MRQVVIAPGEDGYWVADCPSLPGCVSQGRSREEAIANIKEAIEGYIAALKEDGLPVSEEHFGTLVVACEQAAPAFGQRLRQGARQNRLLLRTAARLLHHPAA